MSVKHHLDAEAAEKQAFDQRIEERTQAGLIPDLRRAVKCVTSTRASGVTHIFLNCTGSARRVVSRLAEQTRSAGLRILDVGCGPGCFSLELARAETSHRCH